MNIAEQSMNVRKEMEAPKAKRPFEKPTVAFLRFSAEDVIATSGGGGGSGGCSGSNNYTYQIMQNGCNYNSESTGSSI